MSSDDADDVLLHSELDRKKFLSILNDRGNKSSLIALLEKTLHLDGCIVECGVFRASSIRMISRVILERASHKSIYACDSFEGFPHDGIGNNDTTLFRRKILLKDKFTRATDVPERLIQFFKAFGLNGHVVKGYFSDTLSQISEDKICFLHIDVDIYSSYLECLEELYDKVVSGGIVVFDDYNQPKWPGATKAVDEFFATRSEKPVLCEDREKPAWYLIKP